MPHFAQIDCGINLLITSVVECCFKKTANGTIINLSKQKGNIVHDGLSLQNSNNSLSYTTSANKSEGKNSITVPIGMDYHIKLSDGSDIWMNSATMLEFPSVFAEDKREIILSGEAYLQIAKDAIKPFYVRLPKGTVKVVGTEFNVNSYNAAEIKVALVNGSVIFENESNLLNIKPGNIGILFQNKLTQEVFNPKTVLSWRRGLYLFEDATLDDIAPVLKRWFAVEVIIDNPALKSKRFVGALDKNKPLQEFLHNMRTISKINSYFDKDGILHFK